MLRAKVKVAVERILSEGVVARTGLRRVAKRGLVLGYHNVIPRQAWPIGDTSLHLPIDAFVRQLDYLQEVACVVPLQDLLTESGVPSGDPRPRVALTFDDGYRGALTLGLEELRARGLPATFFIAPGLLGDRTLWWDGLSHPGGQGLRYIRKHAVEDLGGRSQAILRWAMAEGLEFRAMPAECRPVTEAELCALDGIDGITFGAHSWHHPSLRRLDQAHLRLEMERPLRWLRVRLRAVGSWLAYPYGQSSPAAAEAAQGCGYAGALLADGGWLPRRRTSLFQLPRLTVPAGVSPRGFQVRLAGYLCGS